MRGKKDQVIKNIYSDIVPYKRPYNNTIHIVPYKRYLLHTNMKLLLYKKKMLPVGSERLLTLSR